MKKKPVDIIVGIPSYNEADSIPFVTAQADKGLSTYFPHLDCQIVNVDNNSPDDTRKAFLDTETKNEKVYISTPPGVKGKGNNFYNLFKYARETWARAVVVVDADLTSITPEWIKHLGDPVMEGTDFVSPLYLRHKYDGTITNNLVFPLVYSLLNQHDRQPIGGDFAVSRGLFNHYLNQVWTESIRQYGIDIFMTMNALLGKFRTKQVLLGAKLHKPSAPKLGPMFTQVMTTLFDILTAYKDKLPSCGRRTRPEKTYSLPEIDPPDISIDPESIKVAALQEYSIHRQFLKENLSNTTFRDVDKAFNGKELQISSELWADIVFNLLDIYDDEHDKARLIEACKPLYRGTTYFFISRTQHMSSFEAEKEILVQADVFWDKRGRLLFA